METLRRRIELLERQAETQDRNKRTETRRAIECLWEEVADVEETLQPFTRPSTPEPTSADEVQTEGEAVIEEGEVPPTVPPEENEVETTDAMEVDPERTDSDRDHSDAQGTTEEQDEEVDYGSDNC